MKPNTYRAEPCANCGHTIRYASNTACVACSRSKANAAKGYGPPVENTVRSAVLSECGTYRYVLERAAKGEELGTVMFALANPSTADAVEDDATSDKGWRYTKAWKCSRMIYVNANPYRATNPWEAKTPPDSILSLNDAYLRQSAKRADMVVLAYGHVADKALAARMVSVLVSTGAPLYTLQLALDGTPKHPLYLKNNLFPKPYLLSLL